MSSSAKSSAPTIDDLRVKLCWICREEESRDDASSSSSRLWVHPCSCTLVAHQDCLLEWIKESQLQPSRRENALKCPQCNTRYIIDSRNPLVLRIMDSVDRLANRSGKYATLGIVFGVIVTFTGSIYGLCMFYGAHAVRVFVGDRLYNVIVGDDPKDWSWVVYCNLPLVPFYLLASHVRTLDSAIFSTVTLPMLLSLSFPSSSILAATHEPFDLPRFLVTYPPTPTLCVLVYPFLRMWYTYVRDQLTNWVLQTDNQSRQDAAAQRQTWVLEDNDNGGGDGRVLGADLRIDLDLEGPARQQQPQNQEQDNQEGPVAVNDNVEGNANQDEPGHRRVRVTFSSLGRFITRVLVTPWIASYMGSLLELLSHRSLVLRRVLSLHEPFIPPLSWMENVARGSGGLRTLSDVGNALWRKPAMEPVWWRNSLGLSLWIVVRDAVALAHLFLRKRELQSRRIMSRSFAGIDAGTLDLISPAGF
ncbi:hypothetical protein JB92DRAFT_849414 [Gautieria morchelliformis]|nr:hypothetical protein JB92DRAFT_849414 [Gautieria morchelliformis]